MKKYILLFFILFVCIISCKKNENDSEQDCPYTRINFEEVYKETNDSLTIDFYSNITLEIGNLLNKIKKGNLKLEPTFKNIKTEYITRKTPLDVNYVNNYNALVEHICGIIAMIEREKTSATIKESLEKDLIEKVTSFYEYTKEYKLTKEKPINENDDDDKIKKDNAINENDDDDKIKKDNAINENDDDDKIKKDNAINENDIIYGQKAVSHFLSDMKSFNQCRLVDCCAYCLFRFCSNTGEVEIYQDWSGDPIYIKLKVVAYNIILKKGLLKVVKQQEYKEEPKFPNDFVFRIEADKNRIIVGNENGTMEFILEKNWEILDHIGLMDYCPRQYGSDLCRLNLEILSKFSGRIRNEKSYNIRGECCGNKVSSLNFNLEEI